MSSRKKRNKMHKRWGWYKTLIKRKGFKVKLLYFEAGKSISRQRHKYRNELWLFIFGDRKGTYWSIPKGVWHIFTAKKPTLVLEIQYGSKCSERDIERT